MVFASCVTSIAGVDSLTDSTSIVCQAATTKVATPQIKLRNRFGDKVEISVTNVDSYSTSTKFKFYVSGTLVKTVSRNTISNGGGYVNLFGGSKYFKTNGHHTVIVKAVVGSKVSSQAKLAIKTASCTYYNVPKGTTIYTYKNGKMVSCGTASARQTTKGRMTTKTGGILAGRSSDYDRAYIKIDEGTYKGKFVKIGSGVGRITVKSAKQNKVTDYAKSMVGGSYIYGGSSFRATDCSGLTMLSYKQIGITIPHSAASQASVGTSTSISNIKPGDIIVCSGYGHAAMYVGNGKIVHAVNSNTGIIMESISRLQYFGGINAVRRII